MKKPFSYYQWPLGIVVFFILLACFEGFLLTTAFNNAPTSVVERPYEYGLTYQRVIDQKSRARASGMRVDFSVDGPDSKASPARTIRVRLSPSNDLFTHGTLRISRADTNSYDQEVPLTVIPEGGVSDFTAEAAFPKSGLWQLQLVMGEGEQAALFEDSIIIE